MSKLLYDNLFEAIGVDTSKMSVKLAQAPKIVNKSKFLVFSEKTIIQADLIYMPKDGNYNYILTVVDLGSKICDAEPLEERTADAVIRGFEQIFRRKYIKATVKYLYTDPGSEFKNDKFHEYMSNQNIVVRHTMTARKNQMAVVEYYNHIFTKVLGTKMTSEELENGVPNNEWSEALPKIVKALNERDNEGRNVRKLADFFKMPIFKKGDVDKMLKEGDRVHVRLQQPKDALTGERLTGKFRHGDQRFDTKISVIERVTILPNQPPRYLIVGMPNVSFLRSELLLADEAENRREDEAENRKQNEREEAENEERKRQEQHVNNGGKVLELRNRKVFVENTATKNAKYPKMVTG